MRILLFVISFLLSFTSLIAQANIDSLKTVWESNNMPDTSRLRAAGLFIKFGYLYSNPDSAEILSEKMFQHAKGKFPEYEAKASTLKGTSLSIRGKNLEALKWYENSLSLYKSLGNEKGIGVALSNIAREHCTLSNIAIGLQYYNKSLLLFERNDMKRMSAIVLNNIGNVHQKRLNYAKAKEYYARGLEISKEMKNMRGEALGYSNLALIAAHEKDSITMAQNSELALKRFRALGDSIGVMRGLARRGIYFQEVGAYNKARPYFLKIKSLSLQLNDRNTLGTVLHQIATLDVARGQLDSAKYYCTEGLKLAEEINSIHNKQLCHFTLYEIYVKKGNYKKALEMYGIAEALEDSILTEESKQEAIHQEYKYTYLKKSVADSIKNIEQQKVKDAIIAKEKAENKSMKAQRIFLYGGIAGLLIFLTIVINRFLVTKKQKVIIEEQKVAVEEAAKTKLELEQLRQEQLKSDLTNAAQEISRRQQWMESFKEKLLEIKSLSGSTKELNEIFFEISNQMLLDSKNKEFFENIDQVNQEFFQLLKRKIPNISPKEQELCGLIRLNLSTKEIANIRNVVPSSVRMAKSRLKKRLGLGQDDSLQDFILGLSEDSNF